MGFYTINIHCVNISGNKDACKDSDKLYTIHSNETYGYMIFNIPTNV